MTAIHRERLDAQRPTDLPFRAPARALRAITLALFLSFSAVAAVTAQDASTPAASPTPEVTPAPDMPRIELRIEELNDSGISGTATVYDAGDQVIVEFDLEGVGGNHPARIYEGVCGDMNPEPLHELENIDDEGQSTTVVDETLDALLEENHAIGIHLGPNQLGTLIGCADIDGEPTVPEGTPEASPEASPELSPAATPPSDGTGGTIAGTSSTTETSDGTGGAEPTAEMIDASTEIDAATETDASTADVGGQQADEPTPTEPPAPTQAAPTPAPTEEPEPTAAPTEESTSVTGTTESAGDGTGGVTSTTATTAIPSDGTAGVSGKGEPIGGGTSTLPQQAGVGAALPWPQDATDAAIWASAAGATVLGVAAIIVRRGELAPQTTPSRWSRLGL